MSDYRIIVADVLAGLAQLPDESVHCCVTSPPYWGLRDYGVEGQIGLEGTPEQYVENMVAVFREVRRVLRNDGTLWLNLGDSYAGSWGNYGGQNRGNGKQRPITSGSQAHQPSYDGLEGWRPPTASPPGLKPKDLVGIPWMVAFALQADGWWLRQDIIWHKPNPMPESVTDRCTKAHEYVFLLSKSARYWYDADSIREQHVTAERVGERRSYKPGSASSMNAGEHQRMTGAFAGLPLNDAGRNARSVWTIATAPYPEAHFATFPPALVEPCIKAGTSERGCCPQCGAGWEREVEKSRTFESGSGRSGNMPVGKNGAALQGGGETLDIRRGPVVKATTTGWRQACDCPAAAPVPCVVLDPFCGSGTTLAVALTLDRHAVGIELNPEYAALAHRRIGKATRPNTYRDEVKADDAPLFGAAT